MTIIVLIETSWNVKIGAYEVNYDFGGINRNIVECKVWTFSLFWKNHGRINRNIVECKDALQAQLANCCCGINRNIVECKGVTAQWVSVAKVVLIETSWNVKNAPDSVIKMAPLY